MEANLKSAKHHTQLAVMPTDCQLEPIQHQHTRAPSGTPTPLGNNCDSHHQSSHFVGDLPPDIDDTDPDVIPNQYGELNL